MIPPFAVSLPSFSGGRERVSPRGLSAIKKQAYCEEECFLKIPLLFGFPFRKVNIFHLKNNLRTAADIIDSMSFLWPSCPFWVHARSAFSFREHGRLLVPFCFILVNLFHFYLI